MLALLGLEAPAELSVRRGKSGHLGKDLAELLLLRVPGGLLLLVRLLERIEPAHKGSPSPVAAIQLSPHVSNFPVYRARERFDHRREVRARPAELLRFRAVVARERVDKIPALAPHPTATKA